MTPKMRTRLRSCDISNLDGRLTYQYSGKDYSIIRSVGCRIWRKKRKLYEQPNSTPASAGPPGVSGVLHHPIPHVAPPGPKRAGEVAGTHARDAATIRTPARPARDAGLPGRRGSGHADGNQTPDDLRPRPPYATAREVGSGRRR